MNNVLNPFIIRYNSYCQNEDLYVFGSVTLVNNGIVESAHKTDEKPMWPPKMKKKGCKNEFVYSSK